MSKEVTKEDLKKIYDKFITDPDWKIVEELILQFVEPLKSIDSIETQGKTADEVFAQLKGQQVAYEKLTSFLAETKLIETAVTNKPENWR